MSFVYIKRGDNTAKEQLFTSLFSEIQFDKENEITSSNSDSLTGVLFINKLINKIDSDITVIIENFHIDRFYRDCYYMYFSNQHFQIERYCKRLSFFKGSISRIEMINGNKSDTNKNLNSNFIGTCVVRPISGGLIGRSLINPKYVVPKDSSYIRTSKYEVDVLGVRLEVDAFPYQMQDLETMRCSEVTIVNLMDYYSNSYNDYKTTMPSDIVALERKHNHERVLPSRGITYHQLTKILSDLGFAPRLYNIEAIPKNELSSLQQIDHMKRILHYYIASGIPVAVNVEPKGRGVGHSLLCIGHTQKLNFEKAYAQKKYIGNSFESKNAIINSSDFYDDYVVIDDNQFPYEIQKFESLSLYSDMKVTNISVPLYKRMFLEATDAYDISISLLEHEKIGIFNLAKDYLGEEKDIVVRLFLASSRSFKNFRVESFADSCPYMSAYYSNVRMPRFVWVSEIYTVDEYRKSGKAFAELVLDGTSAAKKGARNLILYNYPYNLFARNPDQNEYTIENDTISVDDWIEIQPYSKNLDVF
jgi:hypothetical protein